MIELAIGIFALAAAILLPGGGAAERASRLRRVPAASAAFLVPQIVSTLVQRARGLGAAAEAPLWVSGIGWGAMFVAGLIFFGAGDRIARALGAVRSPAWAFAGLAGGIAWSYLLTFYCSAYMPGRWACKSCFSTLRPRPSLPPSPGTSCCRRRRRMSPMYSTECTHCRHVRPALRPQPPARKEMPRAAAQTAAAAIAAPADGGGGA